MLSEHVKEVCKIGQLHDCCRYLMMSPTGFECAKVQSGLKATLDRRVREQSIIARGDNCEGKEQIPK